MQERNIGGLRTALPAIPTAMPGVSWAVFVPEAAAAEAERVIGELPFDRSDEPGTWNFSPYPEIRKIVKVLISVWLLILLAGLVYQVVNAFK
jgi:hypothetical protein